VIALGVIAAVAAVTGVFLLGYHCGWRDCCRHGRRKDDP